MQTLLALMSGERKQLVLKEPGQTCTVLKDKGLVEVEGLKKKRYFEHKNYSLDTQWLLAEHCVQVLEE